MPFNVTEVQITPNPNARKFMLDKPISESPLSFLKPQEAGDHALAQTLFAIPGVQSLLFLGDFITVNKSRETDWNTIVKEVKKILGKTEQ